MKTLFNSIILLCFLLISCVSTRINETTNRKFIGTLELNVIITGVGEFGEEKIYTNPYLIAGIFPKNNKLSAELIKTLEELKLEVYQPLLDTFNEFYSPFEIGTTEIFVLIKKKNLEAFNQHNSPVLGILRQKFRRFGPIWVNNQKQIQGIFKSRIEVLVKRTEKKFPIDSIIKKYSGEIETFSYVDLDILYRVKLPQNLGNKIVEIAKEISENSAIISAVPMIDVIENGNP